MPEINSEDEDFLEGEESVGDGIPNTLDIEAMAQTPKRTRTDEGTVEERTVDELIKAAQFAGTQNAAQTPLWGIRMARFKPSSTTGGADDYRG